MRLQTLGGLRLENSDFGRPKPLLLLAYLAVEGAKDRRHLAELFWPEASEPATSLRVALGQIRKGEAGVLHDDGQRVSLALESDVSSLLGAIREQHLERVPALYAGGFLEGFSLPDWSVELEEWVYATREFLAAQVRGVLLRLAETEAAQGRFAEAARSAEHAYRVRGANTPEAEDLERLLALLLAGDSLLAGEVLREARDLGLKPTVSAEEARARYAAQVKDSPRAVVLPSARTSFVGRDPELIELETLLCGDEARLLTLLGPGGIGKTRLALRVAGELAQETATWDGVGFVALEPLAHAGQIPAALCEALGLGTQDREDPLAAAIRAIGNRRMLLVLDNCEHLIEAANLVSELLEACPRLRVLVTSRERLHLEEEFVLPLAGLPLPKPGSSLEDAELSDAVRLFVQRARRSRIDYRLDQSDLPFVLEVCGLLEGSPLGIELAAAWVKALPVNEIAQEIRRNLDILETPTRNTKEGHRSLRAVFEQSWARLSGRERDVLAQLAVFQGGFSREAAGEVTGATIPLLVSLVDKSLLRVDATGRYDRHFLLHQYMREKLGLNPELQASTLERHAQFQLRLAATAAPELYGTRKMVWLARLSQEHENLRAALAWAKTQGELEFGLRLAGTLRGFWMIQGFLREGQQTLEEWLSLVIESSQPVTPEVRANALTGAAWMAHGLDDFNLAKLRFEQSARLRRELGQTGGFEAALVNEAMHARANGEYSRATSLLEESLAMHRSEGNQQSIGQDGLGLSLSRLALILCEQGQFERAHALQVECLNLHRKLEDRGGIAATLLGQSDIAREQGDGTRTKALAEESLALFRDLGEQWGVAFSLNNLALAAWCEHDLESATTLAQQSLEIMRNLWGGSPSAEALATVGLIAVARGELHDARAALEESITATMKYGPRWLVAANLESFAGLALRESQAEQAVISLAVADALRTSIGAPLPPLRQAFLEHLKRESQSQLGPALWVKCWQFGTTVRLEDAVKNLLEPQSRILSEVVQVRGEND